MATPIGTLVVEMQANTAKFRADLDKLRTDFDKLNNKAGASTAKLQQAFGQVAQAGRTMAQTVGSNVSPAVAEATTAIGTMITSLGRMPIAAGLAVSAIVALTIVAQRLATELNQTVEAQSKLFLAQERGDVSALRQQLQGLGEQFDILRRHQENASHLFERLKNLDLRGALESGFSALIYQFSKGLDDIKKKGEAAGAAMADLVPREAAAAVAAFNAQFRQIGVSIAQFEATLAETNNDEAEFTQQIRRTTNALYDQADAAAAVNRLKAEEAIRAARADTLLSAEARAAEEGRITDELKNQNTLIRERLTLDLRQARERGRVGLKGIRERTFAGAPEDLAEGLPLGPTILAEDLPRVREVVRGYTDDLDDLRKMQMLVGEASGNLATQQSLIAGQMQKLIADGVQPQDAALTSLTREYNDLGRAINALKDEEVINSLRQQTAELSMTSREVARYRAEMELSAEASDAMREKVGEMAAQLDDQRQAIAMAEEVTQALSSGLVDLLISMDDFDPRQFLIGLAKIITAMAIAQLAAIALKAAIGGIFGGGAAVGGGGTAEILREIPTTASGGVVTSPQLRMVGEAGPEAIIPLSQLGGGGSTVNVEIINQTGTPVAQETERRTGAGGEQMLRVWLRKEMNAALGDGATDTTLGTAFGLKRKGISR